MKKFTLTIVLIFSLFRMINASTFFCFPNTSFTIPEIARRAGVSASFKVIFDVINFEATNIKISSLDSLSYIGLYEKANIENLKNLIYLKDTLNAELIFRYIITPVCKINRDYAEAVSDNEIHFVNREAQVRKSGPHETNCKKFDTLFIKTVIRYRPGSSHPSNILVERIFEDGKDSSIIHVNSHPEYESEILKISNQYSKEYFTNRDSKIKYYFIRFLLLREIPECNGRYEF
ncbi:MAG: hypothetical protein NTX22_16555 [Ignavibacteriales bacterium]|nr:hypothetical protein [Ignavibacteriales bacterium]